MDTRQNELKKISSLLNSLGYKPEKEQPHISGERFLMAPDKLVVVGIRSSDGLRVIIKLSNRPKGQGDIEQEKKVRDILISNVFLKQGILIPKEIYFGKDEGYLFLITEYIHQEKVFLKYPLERQLTILLQSFQSREGLHFTNFKNKQKVSKVFPILQTKDYLENFKGYQEAIFSNYSVPSTKELSEAVWKNLKKNQEIIEKYCMYLVHSDFVPHNFRIKENSMYLLDHSAFQFGNKYEEWARLLNYMVIHNPILETRLKKFVLDKKGETEYLSLRLMRMYKVIYLLKFYTQSLARTSSALFELTSHRIEFWEEVLRSILSDKPVSDKTLQEYIKSRDALRSAEEKNRQKELTAV